MKPPFLLPFLSLTLVAVPLSAQTQGAVFEYISTDPAGEGFNDPTPRSEIDSSILGNNPGATLGEIRQNVLIEAGLRWADLLLSDVPIQVEVDYEDFGGSNGGGITLAGASNTTVAQNFNNAPLADTFYPIALANSLAGVDLASNFSDIRVSVNSNEELSDSQTGSFTWYYGFDGNGPFGTIDFLDVISHELGHGLGFASNVNSATGGYFGGNPNAYTRNIYDTELELSWPQMTAAQRVASSTSDPDLTWDGPNVTGAINGIENFVTRGDNTGSAANNNTLDAQQAGFGGDIPANGINGNLVLVNDGVGVELNNGQGSTADLAQNIQNGAAVAGNVALIARGLESFDVKVRRAEDAGAIAAVVYNNVADGALITASASGTVTEPTIPMVFISLESGNTLRDLLTDGVSLAVFSNRVVIEDDTVDAPATVTRLRLFAPASFQQGSSVSHWTTAATPNLLMEPSINRDIAADLDLSVLLMKDIGWNTQNITIPYLTYDLWSADTGLDQELINRAPGDDFDTDGLSNIEEYYHGSDPLAVNPSQFEFNLDEGTLQYQRSTLSNDLISVLQSGNTFNDFATFTGSETIEALSGQLETVSSAIDLSAEEQFFRLSLETLDSN